MVRTKSKEHRRYKNKTPRGEEFLRTEDKLKNLQEDIKRTARERTQLALDHLKKTESNIINEYVPYLKLRESTHTTIYNHWMEKLTEESKKEIIELENKLRIVGTDEGIREEFTPPFQVKEVRKGKLAGEIKQPSKQQTSRPGTSASIETSNRFGPLENEGESSAMETEVVVEREEEISKKIKERQRGGNKPYQTHKLTPNESLSKRQKTDRRKGRNTSQSRKHQAKRPQW
ncbi:hypothetical protein JTB14_012386 [Gonioctena quinquepunctata]|nr:hypothetical protein JTB14_012386 [Gonioctena quinquepunctata]